MQIIKYQVFNMDAGATCFCNPWLFLTTFKNIIKGDICSWNKSDF